MKRSDIDRRLDEQKRHRQLFGDQLDRINSPANEAIRNLQREMDRPNSATRQAIEAIEQDFDRPNNAAREAMKMLQRERELPYKNALESIREMQKHMMLPNERLLEISRSTAAAAAMALDKDFLKNFASSFAPAMSAIQSLTEQIGRNQLNQIAEIGRDVARRQAELLGSSWSNAVFASAFRGPEIESMLKGITGHVARANADFLKSFGADFFRSIQQSGALANLDVLRQTHAAGLAQQFREAVEKSEDGEELATEITSIVEKSLKETEGNEFLTRQKLMTIIAILSVLGTLYQCFIGTLQYLDSSPKQPPVIRIDVLQDLPRELLRKFFPTSPTEDIEYLLQRDAKLMLRPSFRSQQIGTAMSGSRARLIVRNHKWIFVEAFNALEGISQVGWINKKYSKRII
jgi:hypothetical protein